MHVKSPQSAKVREGCAKGNAKVMSKHRSREVYAKGHAKQIHAFRRVLVSTLISGRQSSANLTQLTRMGYEKQKVGLREVIFANQGLQPPTAQLSHLSQPVVCSLAMFLKV